MHKIARVMRLWFCSLKPVLVQLGAVFRMHKNRSVCCAQVRGGEEPAQRGIGDGTCTDRGFGVDLVKPAGFSWWCRYTSASKC